MYKKHFGLERRIFRGNAAGADVFVGPQTASILASIKKAVSGTDAVITLTGPVGCGKSTAVSHSLSAVSGKNAIVRVGRFPLQRGELLDLLFDHMRIQQRPQRGNQKLVLFRQLLFNLAQNDSRMFILVEDAPFLGPDMLAELEVVTAADTGPSDGAAIVLMGDEYLKELLASKPLSRLRQRIRLRRKLEPCGIEELGGYLRHCFRQAGGDFDKIFTSGSAELLHELSSGILRVANNLVESSMEATAHAKVDVVALDVIRQIADEEFGLTGKFSRLPEIGRKQPEPRHTDDATAELVALSLPEPEPAPAPPVPEQATQEDEDDIPELIQDTQPALAILNDAPPPAKASPQKRSQDTLPDIEAITAELTETAKPEPAKAEPAAKQPSMPEPKAQPKPAADAQAKPRGKTDAEKAKSTAKPSQPVRTEKKPTPAPAVKAEPKPEARPQPAPAVKAEVKPETKPAPAPALETESKPETRPMPAPAKKAEPKPQPKPESASALKAEPKPESKPEPAPEAKTGSPDFAEPELELELELEPEAGPAGDAAVPTLSATTGAYATPAKDVSSDDDKPDWDRDPTLAELRPDLDALERAMAVAQGREPDSGGDSAPTAEPVAEEKPQDEVEEIPEITLDDSINRKVDRAELERKKRLEEEGVLEEEEPEKEEVAAEDRAREEKAAADLEKIAVGLAKAKTIEDVDDKMAETLFGEELSVAAAAVAARVAEEAAAAEAATQEPAGKSDMEKEFENVWGETPGIEVSIESQIEDQKGGLDISASQRLATVRALNTGTPDAAPETAASAPPAPAASPDPIEEQITTSLTQTMKALKVAPEPMAVNDDDDDDDDERKGGFFSRFRRS
jgi:type II secretory pathway predicted ATPase ExeA